MVRVSFILREEYFEFWYFFGLFLAFFWMED